MLNTQPLFKGGTFIIGAMVQYLSLLHSSTKYSSNAGSAHCQWLQIFDKDLKRLIYLGYWKTKNLNCLFSMQKILKSTHKFSGGR